MVEADKHGVAAELESARRNRDAAANEVVLAQARLEEAERALAAVRKQAKAVGL